MAAYYNEIDPFAAEWLRQLIKAGHIASGDVDERSIIDVSADDLRGYSQCHFFAGIAGWSLALRLAGWPDDKPVWTGSCPCQSFSVAGKQKGFADDRHLWPVWFRLIRECRPAVVFGEQVGNAIALGWSDLISADMEGEGYAFRQKVLGAHSVGAPHIRQRLYFGAKQLADSIGARPEGCDQGAVGHERTAVERSCGVGRLADADEQGSGGRGVQRPREGACASIGAALERSQRLREDRRAGPLDGGWRDSDWLYCRDGKWRPVEPALFGLAARVPEGMVRSGAERSAAYPLAEGKIEARAQRLKGYGNAIVPQVAAEFIIATGL